MQKKTIQAITDEINATLRVDANKCPIGESETVVLNSLCSFGVGDAITPLKVLQLLQQQYPYRSENIKLILVMKKDSASKFLKVISDQIDPTLLYTYFHGGRVGFSDDRAAKAQVIVAIENKTFAKVDPQNPQPLDIYKIIAQTTQTRSFLERAVYYHNFSTPVIGHHNCPSDLLPNLRDKPVSTLELTVEGAVQGVVSSEGRAGLAKTRAHLGCVEVDMGIKDGQAGLLLDPVLTELSKQADRIAIADFENQALAKLFLDPNAYKAAGYVQTSSALQIMVEVLAKTTGQKNVHILSNTNLINPEMIAYFPFKQFAKIAIYRNDGTLVVVRKHSDTGNTRELRLLNLNEVDTNDLRLFLAASDASLGSGDNSIQDSLAMGKLFLWQVQPFKPKFYGALNYYCFTHDLKALSDYINVLQRAFLYNGCYSDVSDVNKMIDFINDRGVALVKDIQKFSGILQANFNMLDRINGVLSRRVQAHEQFHNPNSNFGGAMVFGMGAMFEINASNEMGSLLNTFLQDCANCMQSGDAQQLAVFLGKYPFIDLQQRIRVLNSEPVNHMHLLEYCVQNNPEKLIGVLDLYLSRGYHQLARDFMVNVLSLKDGQVSSLIKTRTLALVNLGHSQLVAEPLTRKELLSEELSRHRAASRMQTPKPESGQTTAKSVTVNKRPDPEDGPRKSGPAYSGLKGGWLK